MRVTARGKAMLKIILLDKDGSEIEGTFFGAAAEQFNSLLKEGRVYRFSNGKVNQANPQYSTIEGATHALMFEKYSIIEETLDDGSIKKKNFEFIPI
jgi:hypothetical protein